MDTVFSEKEVNKLETLIGVTFRNKALLEQAITHSSFANEAVVSVGKSYERLEFLGDRVMELVVAEYLFRSFPDKTEGELSVISSALVCNRHIGIVAEDLGLFPFIRIGVGLKKDSALNKRSKRYFLACVFESLVGAIYLDRGLGTAEIFLDEFLMSRLPNLLINDAFLPDTSLLQEVVHKEYGVFPEYECVALVAVGKNKTPRFKMIVSIDGKVVAEGEGPSKKEAKAVVARQALEVEFGIVTDR